MGILSRLTLLLASVALCVAAGELLLRALEPSVAVAVYAPSTRRLSEVGRDTLPGVSGIAQLTVNSWGARGPEPGSEDEYRILAVGGSTTECLVLDDDEAWTNLLQAGLLDRFPDRRFWVGSVGRSGHSSRDHRLQVEALLAQHPSVDAILLLVGGNDLLHRLRSGERYRPLAEESDSYHRGLVRHAFARHPSFEPSGPRIVQRLRRLRTLPVRDESLDRYADLVVLGRIWREVGPFVGELPDLTTGLEDYRRNLEAIHESTRRSGVRLVAMTQPVMWRADLPGPLEKLLWLGAIDQFPKGKKYLATPALAEGMDRYNAELLAVCAERGIECIDLAAQLEKDTSSFYDDMHFNEAGARRVSEVLVDHLATTPPLTLPPAASRGG